MKIVWSDGHDDDDSEAVVALTRAPTKRSIISFFSVWIKEHIVKGKSEKYERIYPTKLQIYVYTQKRKKRGLEWVERGRKKVFSSQTIKPNENKRNGKRLKGKCLWEEEREGKKDN